MQQLFGLPPEAFAPVVLIRVGDIPPESGGSRGPMLYSQRQRLAKPWASATVANSSLLRNSSRTSNCSPRCRRPSCWLNRTESSTTPTDRTQRCKGERPWRSSSNGKRPDYAPALRRTGAAKGGHVSVAEGNRSWYGSTSNTLSIIPLRVVFDSGCLKTANGL